MYKHYLIIFVAAIFLTGCLSQENKKTEESQNSQVTPSEKLVIPDVVYGHKHGVALTFDVFKPKKQNGAGVIWINCAGWVSIWAPFYKQTPTGLRFLTSEELLPFKGITSYDFNEFLTRGYTVFEVRHGSGTKFYLPEIVGDLRRAIRFIRFHSKEYGVDSERLALLGESAGATMALLLGTSSEVGIPAPTDPYPSPEMENFEGVSGRVATIISLVGGGELPKWSAQPGIPDLPKEAMDYYQRLLDIKEEQRLELSPNTYLSSDDPPSLLINGEKDIMVPIASPDSFYKALLKAGVDSKFIILPGAGHDSHNKENSEILQRETLNWLEKYLNVK
jgi:predicted esterase